MKCPKCKEEMLEPDLEEAYNHRATPYWYCSTHKNILKFEVEE